MDLWTKKQTATAAGKNIGIRNEGGTHVVDFLVTQNLALVNTWSTVGILIWDYIGRYGRNSLTVENVSILAALDSVFDL